MGKIKEYKIYTTGICRNSNHPKQKLDHSINNRKLIS